MDLQKQPTNAEQLVLVDKMLGLITGGKTTGMEPEEIFTMGKALEFYRGYLKGKEGVKVPITLKIDESSKLNKKRKGTGILRARLTDQQQP
jgi:hypothetical protein